MHRKILSGLFQCVRESILTIVSAMAEGGSPVAKKLKEDVETSGRAVSKLKKCIILMSYCGKDYMGMQK